MLPSYSLASPWERRGERGNAARVQGEAAGGGVLFGRNGRTAVRSDLAIRVRRTGFRPRRANGFAAQAQVAAWARRESARVPPSRPWAALWLRAAGPRVCWLGRNGLMNRNSSCFLFIFPEIYIFDEFQLEVDANLCAIFVQRQFCSENSAIFKSFWKNNYGHI